MDTVQKTVGYIFASMAGLFFVGGVAVLAWDF